MDCHSKREVLEMNEKNVVAWFFFLKPATNSSVFFTIFRTSDHVTYLVTY